MTKLNVKELMEDLNIGEYGSDITNYASGYISDILNEIADTNVDTYNSDLWDWARDNQQWIEEWVNTNGTDNNFDLMNLFRCGQYLQIDDDLYSNLDDIIKYYIYHNLNLEECSSDVVDIINDYCDSIDSGLNLDRLLEDINNELE